MATSFKILPNNYLKDWGEFESWAAGSASAPDGWIIATAPSLAQESVNIKFGVYSARIIGSTGAGVGGIYRTIPDGTNYRGRTFKLGVWGKSSSTGPYIEINDGVSSQTVHLDGLNAFSFFTTPGMKLDINATQVRINLFATQTSTAYFDGAVLCEGEDLFTSLVDGNVLVDKWSPSLSLKQDQYEISQREGSFIPDNHLQNRNISVGGTVVGSDVASTRTNFDILMKSLLAWQTDEKRHVYLYDDRVADVYLKGLNWDYVGRNCQMIKYSLQFSCPDSTTRYVGRLRKRQVTTGTAIEFSIPYLGNAFSLPVISFIANQGSAITTCQLQNLTTGDTMAYIGTVPTNVALDIDCYSGTVFNSSVSDFTNFGTSDFIKLVRGINYFRYSGTPCQINIDYFDRYL